MEKRPNVFWWVFAVTLIVATAAVSFLRLDFLPNLDFSVGPDLIVRDVHTELPAVELNLHLQRGDRITAVTGHGVQSLEDIRAVFTDLALASSQSEERLDAAEIQAVRPLHRFTVTLFNEQFDGAGLPPGIEATDNLVEVDGRALPGKVGPEGLKSIMASRPAAILGFERTNAVFRIQAPLQPRTADRFYMVAFLLAIFVIAALARFSSPRLDPRLPVAVAIETAMVAPLVVVLLKYQWVLADPLLTSIACLALVMVRPVAFVGRHNADDEQSWGTLFAFGLALLAAGLVVALLWQGTIDSERALQFSAILAFFYVLYELVAGMTRGRERALPDRGVYLVGILVVSALAATVAFFVAPEAFVERLWVHFAAVMVGLVWLSDAVLCFRGPELTGLDEVQSKAQRYQLIEAYLGELDEELEASRSKIVIHGVQQTVVFGRGLTGLEVSKSDAALRDAMTILVEEGGSVPVAAARQHTDPLAGIASSMGLTMALRVFPPSGGLEVEASQLIVIAQTRDGYSDTADEPRAPAVGFEVLEKAQEAMTPTVWAAALVEGIARLESMGRTEAVEPAPRTSSIVEDLNDRIEELEEQTLLLRDDRSELARQNQAIANQMRTVVAPALNRMDEVLEPELIDGLRYLLETDEPCVLCGPVGAGKSFAAFAADSLDTIYPGPIGVLDAANYERGFPDLSDLDESLFEALLGGGLLIRSARLLSEQQIKALTHKAGGTFRLYLAFDEADPVRHSALDPFTPEVRDALEHREVIIPPFSDRAVKGSIINFLVSIESRRHRKELVGLSPGLEDALMSYPFPGQISECRAMVSAAIATCEGDVLDIDHVLGLKDWLETTSEQPGDL